ncbi:hypothetical protein [Longimicrobium sp.]|uniref:hypothetical protein n=1 Tax=Longimicrobium sp. TaxID=2029185 RepID=UPI003B3B3CF8
MNHLPVTSRIRLPEPLSIIHSLVRHDGRRAVAVGERTGQLWLLDIDPDSRSCVPSALPIHLPRNEDGRDWNVRLMTASHALDRLLLWTDQARVHAISSGDVVAELWPHSEGALCLSPSGRWAIRLEEERGAVMDLDAPFPAWRETSAFHVTEGASGELEWIYLDHVDDVVAHPCEGEPLLAEEETFWLAAGCYGEVFTHQVEGDLDVRRVPGRTRGFGGLVYDPTQLVRPFGQRHLFVLHGFGMGLAALDPATGERYDCLMRPPQRRTYAFFHRVVPCGAAPLAWGTSVDGSFLWRVGDPPVRMPDAPGPVVALYPDALLSLAPDGTELLWGDLTVPPS